MPLEQIFLDFLQFQIEDSRDEVRTVLTLLPTFLILRYLSIEGYMS
jgi:hypothetical protein